jgi:lysozyme
MIVVSELTDLIAEHEGKSLVMYTDTVGVPTIGYGHNLQTPISEHAAKVILADDVKVAIDELDDRMDWWRDLPDPAQLVLASMVFNLGWPRFSRFKKLIAALEDRDFNEAAAQMEDSLWYQQIKTRGPVLKQLMLNCNDTL